MTDPIAGDVLEIDTPEWAVPAATTDARYVALYGGRGGGKSVFFAETLCQRGVRNPSFSAVCVREVQKSLEESVKKDIGDAIVKYQLADHFEVLDAQIRNKHGPGRFIFAGMATHSADGFKSYSGNDVAWVEEAQALSRRSLDVLLPTIRKDNSQIWFSWNPRRETDPVDDFFRCNSEKSKEDGRAPPENSCIIGVNYWDNPWFRDPLKKEMTDCRDRPNNLDEYDHVWCGGYERISEARVFKRVTIKAFDDPPPATMFYFGADWGYSDATVLVRCFIVGKRLFVDYEAVAAGITIDATPALFASIEGADEWPIIADSEDPQMIRHMREHGFRKMVGAIKGPKSVDAGIKFLQDYDLVVHPRCKTLIGELARYSYKIDPATKLVTPHLDEKAFHPNVIHALRYAIEPIRRGMESKPKVLPPMPAISGRFRT